MAKTIVTHLSPDLDAIGAIWLLKKFASEFADAKVEFVPIGKTWKGVAVDSSPSVIYVDIGKGKFDHHQRERKTCAAGLVWKWLGEKRAALLKDKALVRLVDLVCEIDHFGECFWPKAASDRYEIGLVSEIQGLKLFGKTDKEITEFGLTALDGIYVNLKNKVNAEEELKRGEKFETRWGKALGIETRNDEVLKLGLKLGYKVVARKDPKTSQVRIKSAPDPKIDLTYAYKKLKKMDSEATWFFHIGKHQLLNASTRVPGTVPSKLTLKQVIEVLKKE